MSESMEAMDGLSAGSGNVVETIRAARAKVNALEDQLRSRSLEADHAWAGILQGQNEERRKLRTTLSGLSKDDAGRQPVLARLSYLDGIADGTRERTIGFRPIVLQNARTELAEAMALL